MRLCVLGLLLLLVGCTAKTVSLQNETISLQLVASGLEGPLLLVQHGSDVYVTEQVGRIRKYPSMEVVLDISDRMVTLSPIYDERGLLGLAFHPNNSELYYVYYNAPRRITGYDSTATLSEFNMSDSSYERIILQIDKPESNHNGGTILFGPDGYLYLSIGDGGAANDEGFGHPGMGNGQNKSALLGKILRIDLSSKPYAIPPDNPFGNEVYAYGLRNPFRFSFNNGELIAADVGQNLWEEVDIITKGGNYGWRIKEGRHCFNPSTNCPSTGIDGTPLIEPVLEYGHDKGTAIIGGYIYNGSIQGIRGHYVFGDYTGGIFAADENWSMISLGLQLDGNLLGISTDASGELYFLLSSGKVYKLI